MREFEINKYFSLKFEDNKTYIYVGNERFHKCKYLLLNIPIDKIQTFDQIESIDEAAEKLDKTMETEAYKVDIPPETEFWGHCSNLQVWAEHDYNTRLLHSNLAFSLLKKLVEVGDPIAKKVFKDEIAERFSSGYEPVAIYLIQEDYLNYLNDEELKTLIEEFKDSPEKIIPLLQYSQKISKLALDFLAKGKPLPFIKELIKHSKPENRAMFLYQIGSYIANVKINPTFFQSEVTIERSEDSNIELGIKVMELALELPKIPDKLALVLPYLYGTENRWDKAIIVYEKAIECNGLKPMFVTGMFMAAFYTGRQDIIDKYIEESIKNIEIISNPYSISNVLYALNRKETEQDSKTALELVKVYWNSLKTNMLKIPGHEMVFSEKPEDRMIPSLWVNMTDTYIVADIIDDTCEEIINDVLNHLDEMHPVIYENLAWIFLKKNQTDKAIHYLKEAKMKGHPGFKEIKNSQYFKSLKDNPEFIKLFN
jgi:tetratricopeptide (TPR) repeat protein